MKMSDNENIAEKVNNVSSTNSRTDTTPKIDTNTDQNKGDGNVNNNSETCDCTICFLPITQNTDIIVLEECGHVFHSTCIRLWMKQKRTCPFCAGFSLLPEEYPRLS